MSPTPAALKAAERFLEIERIHGANHKGKWAMFNAALTRYGVDEWQVENALEWLELRALEL